MSECIKKYLCCCLNPKLPPIPESPPPRKVQIVESIPTPVPEQEQKFVDNYLEGSDPVGAIVESQEVEGLTQASFDVILQQDKFTPKSFDYVTHDRTEAKAYYEAVRYSKKQNPPSATSMLRELLTLIPQDQAKPKTNNNSNTINPRTSTNSSKSKDARFKNQQRLRAAYGESTVKNVQKKMNKSTSSKTNPQAVISKSREKLASESIQAQAVARPAIPNNPSKYLQRPQMVMMQQEGEPGREFLNEEDNQNCEDLDFTALPLQSKFKVRPSKVSQLTPQTVSITIKSKERFLESGSSDQFKQIREELQEREEDQLYDQRPRNNVQSQDRTVNSRSAIQKSKMRGVINPPQSKTTIAPQTRLTDTQFQAQGDKRLRELKDFKEKAANMLEDLESTAKSSQQENYLKIIKVFVFLYTSPYIYRNLNKSFSSNQYQNFAKLTGFIAETVQKLPPKYKDKLSLNPVSKIKLYRGIYETNVKMPVRGFWKSFTSTSLRKDVSEKFANRGKGTVIEIRLKAPTGHMHIKVPKSRQFSEFDESEVILFPFFQYQVVQKKNDYFIVKQVKEGPEFNYQKSG